MWHQLQCKLIKISNFHQNDRVFSFRLIIYICKISRIKNLQTINKVQPDSKQSFIEYLLFHNINDDKPPKKVDLWYFSIYQQVNFQSNYQHLQQTMIEDNLFMNEWGIWFCFLADPNQSNDKYYQNFVLVYNILAPADLAYVWNHHKLNNLDNFLMQNNSKQFTYQVKQKWRRVNSIEYFKKGIEPKWEDPKNQKGGRFVFAVNKTQDNKDQIYSNLVFYLMGQDFDHSERINGFRFISAKNPQSYYRVEIWVDFDDTNMEVLKHFQELLTNLFQSLNFDSRSVRFLNNRSEPTTNKEGREGKQRAK